MVTTVSQAMDSESSIASMTSGVSLMSQSGAGPVEIHIGPDVEQEKSLSPSSVPLFIRKAVLDVAKKENRVSEKETVESIDVPSLLQSTATIRTYVNGVEESYVRPTGCMICCQSEG